MDLAIAAALEESGEDSSLWEKSLGAVGSVLGAPKHAVDYLARESAQNLFGLPVKNDATVGQMVRSGVGLNQGDEGYGGALAGKATEIATDVAMDPSTWAMAGLGGAVKAGKTAEAAIGMASRGGEGVMAALTPEASAAALRVAQSGRLAAPVKKAADVGFTGMMGIGAVQEGQALAQTVGEEGFTPQAAEQALGLAVGAGGAALGGYHMLGGKKTLPVEGEVNPREAAASKIQETLRAKGYGKQVDPAILEALMDDVVAGKIQPEQLAEQVVSPEKTTVPSPGEVGRGVWGAKTERRLGGPQQGPLLNEQQAELARRQQELLGDQPNPFETQPEPKIESSASKLKPEDFLKDIKGYLDEINKLKKPVTDQELIDRESKNIEGQLSDEIAKVRPSRPSLTPDQIAERDANQAAYTAWMDKEAELQRQYDDVFDTWESMEDPESPAAKSLYKEAERLAGEIEDAEAQVDKFGKYSLPVGKGPKIENALSKEQVGADFVREAQFSEGDPAALAMMESDARAKGIKKLFQDFMDEANEAVGRVVGEEGIGPYMTEQSTMTHRPRIVGHNVGGSRIQINIPQLVTEVAHRLERDGLSLAMGPKLFAAELRSLARHELMHSIKDQGHEGEAFFDKVYDPTGQWRESTTDAGPQGDSKRLILGPGSHHSYHGLLEGELTRDLSKNPTPFSDSLMSEAAQPYLNQLWDDALSFTMDMQAIPKKQVQPVKAVMPTTMSSTSKVPPPYRDMTDLGKAGPDRKIKIGRGAKGQIDVIFENAFDKDLFSAVGRGRKTLSGEGGRGPDWQGLADKYGVSTEQIGELANNYRKQVMDAVAGLKEGEAFTAPRPEGIKTERFIGAKEKGDAALGKELEATPLQGIAAMDAEMAARRARLAKMDPTPNKLRGQLDEAWSESEARMKAEEAAPKPKTLDPNDEALIRERLRTVSNVTKIQAENLVQVAKDNPEMLPDILRAIENPKLHEKALELWKMGLLSGPSTWLVNLSDALETGLRLGETGIAPAIDKLIGGPRSRFKGEAGMELKGSSSMVPHALGNFARDMKNALLAGPETIDFSRPVEFQIGKIGGTAGRIIRTPARILQAFTDFLKTVNSRGELEKLAFRKAKLENAADPTARAAQILKELSDLDNNDHMDLVREAEKNVRDKVYQGEPGPLLNSLLRMRQDNPWMHIVLPFLQVPGNITKLILQRTPLGFVKAAKAHKAYVEAIKSGAEKSKIETLKGQAVDAIARPLLGTTIISALALMAKSGMMTGGGSSDPKDKNALLASGAQPYSFKVPMGAGQFAYIPFSRFQPVGSLLGFAADIAEGTDAKFQGSKFDKALDSIGKNITSPTYLQGLADALEFASKPKDMAGKYLSSLSGSLVPNIVGRAAQAADPIMRETRGKSVPEVIQRSVMARIPGLSEKVPAKYGITGEPIKRHGNAATRFASPTQPSIAKGEDVEFFEWLSSIDATPAIPRREATDPQSKQKVPFTEEEYAEVAGANREALDYIKDNYFGNDRFMELPKERQKLYIQRIYAKMRTAKRAPIIGSPEFRGRDEDVAVSP